MVHAELSIPANFFLVLPSVLKKKAGSGMSAVGWSAGLRETRTGVRDFGLCDDSLILLLHCEILHYVKQGPCLSSKACQKACHISLIILVVSSSIESSRSEAQASAPHSTG